MFCLVFCLMYNRASCFCTNIFCYYILLLDKVPIIMGASWQSKAIHCTVALICGVFSGNGEWCGIYLACLHVWLLLQPNVKRNIACHLQ